MQGVYFKSVYLTLLLISSLILVGTWQVTLVSMFAVTHRIGEILGQEQEQGSTLCLGLGLTTMYNSIASSEERFPILFSSYSPGLRVGLHLPHND